VLSVPTVYPLQRLLRACNPQQLTLLAGCSEEEMQDVAIVMECWLLFLRAPASEYAQPPQPPIAVIVEVSQTDHAGVIRKSVRDAIACFMTPWSSSKAGI
jgi:hypothetical protein